MIILLSDHRNIMINIMIVLLLRHCNIMITIMIVFLPRNVRVRTIVKDKGYLSMHEHTIMHEVSTLFPFSVSFNTTLLAFHTIFHIISHIVYHIFHAYVGVVFHASSPF